MWELSLLLILTSGHNSSQFFGLHIITVLNHPSRHRTLHVSNHNTMNDAGQHILHDLFVRATILHLIEMWVSLPQTHKR